MSNLDTLTYLVGAVTISAVCGAALVSFVVCVYGALVLAFRYWSRKVLNVAVNWHAVSAWNSAGRPDWKCGQDRVFRMVPTAGPYAQDGDIIHPDKD